MLEKQANPVLVNILAERQTNGAEGKKEASRR